MSAGKGTNDQFLIFLREAISNTFNQEELSLLAFDLNVKYDNLSGQTLDTKIAYLLGYMERRGRLSELINKLKELRPHIEWEYSTTSIQSTAKSNNHPVNQRMQKTNQSIRSFSSAIPLANLQIEKNENREIFLALVWLFGWSVLSTISLRSMVSSFLTTTLGGNLNPLLINSIVFLFGAVLFGSSPLIIGLKNRKGVEKTIKDSLMSGAFATVTGAIIFGFPLLMWDVVGLTSILFIIPILFWLGAYYKAGLTGARNALIVSCVIIILAITLTSGYSQARTGILSNWLSKQFLEIPLIADILTLLLLGLMGGGIIGFIDGGKKLAKKSSELGVLIALNTGFLLILNRWSGENQIILTALGAVTAAMIGNKHLRSLGNYNRKTRTIKNIPYSLIVMVGLAGLGYLIGTGFDQGWVSIGNALENEWIWFARGGFIGLVLGVLTGAWFGFPDLNQPIR